MQPVAVVRGRDELALVEPVAAVRFLAGGEQGGAILERQAEDLAAGAAQFLSGIAERRREHANWGADALGLRLFLVVFLGLRRRLGLWSRRYALVTVGRRAIDQRRRFAVVPLVRDDAVPVRRAAREDRRVAR